MKMYLRFLIVWLVNGLILYLANLYWPKSYVLGNAVMTPTMATVLSSFLLTVFLRFAKSLGKRFTGSRYRMFIYYFLANSVGIWILARLSVVSGFGIPAFYFAFYLGFVVAIGQWISRQLFKKAGLLEK